MLSPILKSPSVLSDDLSIPDDEGSFINPGALDSNQDVYFANADNDIRVITGLERGGTPATFLITGVTTLNNRGVAAAAAVATTAIDAVVLT